MRAPAVVRSLVLLGAVAIAGRAGADSWMPPRPLLHSALDGRHYAIVNPGEGYTRAEVLLVRRKEGAPPRASLLEEREYALEGPRRLEPEAGDEVIARAKTRMPMSVRCQSGGAGFVLFDTYAQLGSGVVVDRYDGSGALVWARSLGDLYTPAEIEAFPHTVSSIWWSHAWWLAEALGAVVVVDQSRGLRIVALPDGRLRTMPGEKREALLPRLLEGPADERRQILDAVLFATPPKHLAEAFRRDGAAWVEDLRSLLESGDDQRRLDGATGLALVGSPAVSAIVAVIRDASLGKAPRVAAAHVLKEMGPPASLEAVPGLIEALAKAEAGEDASAAPLFLIALRNAAGEDAGASATAWRAWWAARPR